MSAHRKPCPLPTAKDGKHAWKFQKNAGSATIKAGPLGGRGTFSVVGIYACACGATRTGTPNHSAPGNDLRDHFPTALKGKQ